MKRFIISLFLFSGMLVLSVCSCVYVNRNTEEMIIKTEKIRENIIAEEYEKALILSDDLKNQWTKFSNHHFYIIDSQNIMEITNLFARTTSLISQKNKDAVTECDAALGLLTLYKNKNTIMIKDIL
ncbi:MAG: DUF4363 family protein [Eubacterium sp.]|jgi:hypothetical protein|nr:DUF4363 family protein [Eubacterium sp.]